MSGKATVMAPSNIAFIKYWGTRDLESTLPFNPSLSMTLSRCATRTTVECLGEIATDEVSVRTGTNGFEPASEAFAAGVIEHLDRLRAWAGSDQHFRVATENTFPMGTGLASSASGFAALALAVAAALDREVSPQEASVLARSSGSGSAARSVIGGFVEWPAAGDESGAAVQFLAAEHWDLRDVIAVLDFESKEISSREGHRRAPSSPYFERRLQELPQRLDRVRRALSDRDFAELAQVMEEEAIDLHLIAMSSRPPIFYWQPGTLKVLAAVRQLRRGGENVCATMDAGANVHLICTPTSEDRVVAELNTIADVQDVIRDGVGRGPQFLEEHLF